MRKLIFILIFSLSEHATNLSGSQFSLLPLLDVVLLKILPNPPIANTNSTTNPYNTGAD